MSGYYNQDTVIELANENTALRAELERIKIKIMNALGNGSDERLWPPGENYIDAACETIETYKYILNNEVY